MSTSKRTAALSLEGIMRRTLAVLMPAAAQPKPEPVPGMPTVPELMTHLKAALEQFGSYHFMDDAGLAARLRTCPAPAVASVLRSFAHSGKGESEEVAQYAGFAAANLVITLSSWKELCEQPGMDALLRDEMPALQPGDAPDGVEPAAFTKRRFRT